MTRFFTEVKSDDVTKLFRSMPFRSSLRQAAAFTKRTGYESALCVARDFYLGSCYVSRMLKGTTEGFEINGRTYGGRLADYDFGEQNIHFEHCYRFLGLHFHPDLTECPIPSSRDLMTAQGGTEPWDAYESIDVRPIIAVAHILENNRIVALLYQKSIEGDIEHMQDFQDLNSDLYAIDFPAPPYVVDCLEESGLFYADILTLEKKRHYSPNKKDYAKLKRFTSTPRRRAATGDSIHQSVYMELYSDET